MNGVRGRGAVIVLASGILLMALASSCPAQGPDHEHGTHEHGLPQGIPLEILQRPVSLRQGIGVIHDPVSTASKEAQAFYDQGTAYLHSYVWIEAARSFYQALRLDSDLALAYLGLSYAFSGLNSSAAARAALEKARELSGRITKREQQRVLIRARQLDAMADPGNAVLIAQYRQATQSAIALYPDDIELWLA
ncbi:MAG TPA: hypothetical protein VJX67_10830, partial [Blastocatellia bacterium]|nr:hypothetical protein [Blastocatellia bacterium]